MKIKTIVSEPTNIHNYCGKIIITYSLKDEKAIDSLFKSFSNKGYEVTKNPLSKELIKGDKYVSEINDTLKKAKLLIVVFSDNLLKDDVLRRMVWYQMGYMETIKKDHTVVLINTSNFESFKKRYNESGWPVKHEEYGKISKKADDNNAFVDRIIKKYNNELLKTIFFSDNGLNSYVVNKLKYQKLHMNFELSKEEYESLMKKACENQTNNNENHKWLLSNITHATRILRFGYDQEDPKLAIYNGEMNVTDNNIFPISFENRKWIEINEKKESKYFNLHLEFIFPVHPKIGVTIKPFIKWKNPNNFYLIKDFFKENISEDEKANKDVTFSSFEESTIYFNPVIKDVVERRKDADENWHVGNKCEFVYPE